MTRRVLPVALVVAAAAVGAEGHDRAGFYLLVAAIPAAAVAALALYGELLDAPARAPGLALLRLELTLAVSGLALLVVATAVRSGAGDGVPAASATALGACLAVLLTQALLTLLTPPQPEPGASA